MSSNEEKSDDTEIITITEIDFEESGVEVDPLKETFIVVEQEEWELSE